MVQITNALVAAAIIVPALAAPVIDAREELETREPKLTVSAGRVQSITKGAGRIAHTAKSGIELGAAVAPLFPHRQRRSFDESETLDARDPKFNFGKVLGKVASFVLREDEMDGGLYERDFEDSELDARDPKFNFGKVLGKVASFVLRDDEMDGLYERDFEDSELDARDPKFNFGKALGKVASFVLRDDEMDGGLYERDFDEAELLDAREPKFHISKSTLRKVGHAAGHAARFAGQIAMNAQQRRDFDDSELLDARDPKINFGRIVRGAARVAQNFIRDDETGEVYYVRDAHNMEELD